MRSMKDETGNNYGKLKVCNRVFRGSRHAEWLCQCECGGTTIATGNNLRRGRVQSCGCGRDAASLARFTTHGMTHSRLYRIYNSAKARCCNPKNQAFNNYGGRGVQFKFADFQHFVDVVRDGYSDALTLDRINVNGHYEPGNLRWVTVKQQGANKRNNTLLEYCGKTLHLSEVARLIGLPQTTISNRVLRYGPSDPRVFFKGRIRKNMSINMEY